MNSIFLTKGEEAEGSNRTKVTPENAEKLTKTETETPVMEGLVNNNRFNNSRSRTQAGKKKGKEYKVLPGGPAYDAILKKKITKKEDIRGNFEIPCSIGNLKYVNTLVDQGSDMNVMPYSTYMKLTNERPAETDIRLSLASHSENENRPFIVGTPFLTTTKASIKFDTSTITLRLGNHKLSFHMIPDSSNVTDKGVKNDIEPTAPTMTINRLVLEWEEKIKLHLEREMQFNQWRSKNFKGMHPTLIATKEGMDDEEEVTSIGIDIPVCPGLTLVKQTQFHLSQLRMLRVSYLTEYMKSALVYWQCRGPRLSFMTEFIWSSVRTDILRLLSLLSKDGHIGIRALGYRELGCIREMSQSLSSNVPDNSPEQEATTEHSIPKTPGPSRKRSRSPSSPFYPDASTFSDGKPASKTSELNPEDVTARLEDIEVEIDTLRADTEDKELLISELQDSIAAAENEISLLQIKADDAESRRAEDHEQI
ncbi:hypothetical protein Tco_0529298 [Tanacetum coccineum]